MGEVEAEELGVTEAAEVEDEVEAMDMNLPLQHCIRKQAQSQHQAQT